MIQNHYGRVIPSSSLCVLNRCQSRTFRPVSVAKQIAPRHQNYGYLRHYGEILGLIPSFTTTFFALKVVAEKGLSFSVSEKVKNCFNWHDLCRRVVGISRVCQLRQSKIIPCHRSHAYMIAPPS